MRSVRRLVIVGLCLLTLIATASAAQVSVDHVYLPLLAVETVRPAATTMMTRTATTTVTVRPTQTATTLTPTTWQLPTRTPIRDFDGRWVGTTSGGKPFSFDFVDGMITRLSFGFAAPNCGIIDNTIVRTYQPPLFIEDPTNFTISDTIPGPSTVTFTIRGNVAWPGQAAGNIQIQVQGSPADPGCSDNQLRGWEATYQQGSAPTVTPTATGTPPTSTPFPTSTPPVRITPTGTP